MHLPVYLPVYLPVFLPVIATLVALLLFATLLPLSRKTKWWVRDLDLPRLQIAVLALRMLAAQLVLLDLDQVLPQLMLSATVCCLLYQAWWIVPYTRAFPSEVLVTAAGADAGRIRILTANVLTPNRHANRLAGADTRAPAGCLRHPRI